MAATGIQRRIWEAASCPPATYRFTRWIFLRLLGAVSFGAFLSLSVQLRGLVGSDGVLPVADHLRAARAALGGGALRELPTLFWISASDAALLAVAVAGLAASALLAAGRLEGPALAVSWACYLSLCVAGQTFLAFQWDALLLEALLCGSFWAAWGWRSQPFSPEPAAGRWLVWLLVFKLMFLSGATKLLSGDATWRDLSALAYHYQTQPLPSWISWYFHHLPAWFHRASVVAMLATELAFPLLLLLPWKPRLARRLAAAGFVGLQLLIAWTGNYGFFNPLAMVLALSLVDDGVWRRSLPRLAARLEERRAASRPSPVAIALGCAIAGLSLVVFSAELQRTAGSRLPDWQNAVLQELSPWRSINGYGLFRVMTTERPEIAVEVSDDLASWRELRFRFKPGDPTRRPAVFLLHMPRLDWQMWFAALGPRRAEAWLAPLVERLLANEPQVWRLLDEPPRAAPPRAARLQLYDYRFATPAERSASGAWWRRAERGELGPVLALDAGGRLVALPR